MTKNPYTTGTPRFLLWDALQGVEGALAHHAARVKEYERTVNTLGAHGFSPTIMEPSEAALALARASEREAAGKAKAFRLAICYISSCIGPHGALPEDEI